MSVKPIPEGFHSVTPYLSVKGETEAIEFYKRSFNEAEVLRMPTPGGEIGHAEIELGGSSVGLYLYVEDVDAIFAQAVKAGASEVTTCGRPVLWRSHGHTKRSIRTHLVSQYT